MKADIKALWLKALRSGEYKKGTGQLVVTKKNSDEVKGYCCLGVLTDLYIKENPKYRKWGKTAGYGDATLPTSVARWAGIAGTDPRIEVSGSLKHLSELNDGNKVSFPKTRWIRKPLSFAKIADLIEKHL